MVELLFLVGVATVFEKLVVALHGKDLLLALALVRDGPLHFQLQAKAMNLDLVNRDYKFAVGRADNALSQRNLVVQRDHEKLLVGLERTNANIITQ